MKKIIFLTVFLLAALVSFSQEVHKETFYINSKTLINGGDYVMIPKTLGRTTKIVTLDIKYDFKTTAYTVASGTDVTIKTLTGDGTVKNVVSIDDSLFEGVVKSLAPSGVLKTNYGYNNEIVISVPSSKFTNGDADIYVIISYTLEQ